MICDTGTPLSFAISFAMSDIPVNMPGCAESIFGDIMECIVPLIIVPILSAMRRLKSRTSL